MAKYILFLSFFSLLACQHIGSRKLASVKDYKYPEFKLQKELIVNPENCHSGSDKFLERGDYDFQTYVSETGIDYYGSRKDFQKRFTELYKSGKRLKDHLYLEDQNFYLPVNESLVKVPKDFLKQIIHQVELAHKLGAAEFLFFPDMGHAHIFFPDESWGEIRDLPKSERMRVAFQSPNTKFLYHTAEKLMLKNGNIQRDPLAYRKFRYRTRNLVGSFRGLGALEILFAHGNSMYNTIDSEKGLRGYRGKRTSLYLHASKNGCLGYKVDGDIRYFDLSLTYL